MRLAFSTGGVHRDADAGAAVPLRVDQVDGRFVSGHKTPVGIGGGGGKRQQSRRVLEQSADVVDGRVAEVERTCPCGRTVVLALPQALVDVHAGAVVLENAAWA